MEHEDLERMEKGIYTDGFFNLTDDNIYKSKIIKDIDSNIGQLLKTDAKFFAIHVSPSESELRIMGNTEQEKTEADIKFYGKIHFDRSRSDNELNMHCHLIVSRKDQANKKKLSPLTNHKNTKKGTVTGGFDRVNLFQQAEQGFDKLFGYHRQLSEAFEYYNTMKNGSMTDKLQMQERELKESKMPFADEKKKIVDIKTDENIKAQTNKNAKTFSDTSIQQQTSENGLSSLFAILPSATGINPTDEQQPLKPKKKKKRRPKLS